MNLLLVMFKISGENLPFHGYVATLNVFFPAISFVPEQFVVILINHNFHLFYWSITVKIIYSVFASFTLSEFYDSQVMCQLLNSPHPNFCTFLS